MYWTVMDSTAELSLLFYTLISPNNNSLRKDLRVLLLSISHLGKEVNLNKEKISDTNLIQWQKPYLVL